MEPASFLPLKRTTASVGGHWAQMQVAEDAEDVRRARGVPLPMSAVASTAARAVASCVDARRARGAAGEVAAVVVSRTHEMLSMSRAHTHRVADDCASASVHRRAKDDGTRYVLPWPDTATVNLKVPAAPRSV